MTRPILLAVPNVSEGRDKRVIEAIGDAFAGSGTAAGAAGTGGGLGAAGAARGDTAGGRLRDRPALDGVRLLDVHSDADHHRSVFTLAGPQGQIADAVFRGAAEAVELVDVTRREGPPGQHPYVGAIDVAPVVYLSADDRGAACAETLVLADRIGAELGIPVFLYGELAGAQQRATRAELRRGGVAGLADRMASGTGSRAPYRPDFGPARMHPTAGAALVAARAPLVAFNMQLRSPATVATARAVAALIREGGVEGLPGVRAIAVTLSDGVAQVSTNVERPLETPLADVVAAVGMHADLASAEIVGLAPRAALEGFPRNVPLSGFDPARQLIENALGS